MQLQLQQLLWKRQQSILARARDEVKQGQFKSNKITFRGILKRRKTKLDYQNALY
jgi:hypothetical protein